MITAYHLKGEIEKAVEEENKKGRNFELKLERVMISYYLKNWVFYNDRNTIINIPGKIRKEEEKNEVIVIEANMEAFQSFLNQTPDGFFKVQAQKIYSTLREGVEISVEEEIGEEVFVVGYSIFPAVENNFYFLPHIFGGKIKFQKNEWLYCQVPSEPGFSGGAVIDEKGKLKGMSVMSSPGKNFIIAVPSQVIKDILKKEEK